MMYRRPHKKCEREPRRGGDIVKNETFGIASVYGRTNSSMDQVLMTGTAERRRRYRAIDKPLRASVAKMNRAVIRERITLNRAARLGSARRRYHDNNKFADTIVSFETDIAGDIDCGHAAIRGNLCD